MFAVVRESRETSIGWIKRAPGGQSKAVLVRCDGSILMLIVSFSVQNPVAF